MTKMKKLTKAREADIPQTIEAWLANAKEPIDKQVAIEVVNQSYARVNKEPPLVVFASSPIAAVILHHIWEDFWKRFSPELEKSGTVDIEVRTGNSLGGSLRASLGDSLSDSLRDSLGDSLRASLSDSLSASLSDSLSVSLLTSLSDSLRASLSDSHWTLWWHGYWYGGFSTVDFCQRNLGLLENSPEAKLWLDIGKNIQMWIPCSNVCIIAEKPTELHWSENQTPKVLDYDHGAAVVYSDGWKIFALNGVMFDEETYWKLVNKEFTLNDLTRGNFTAEQRPVILQHLRPELIAKQLDAKLISTGKKYQLLLERFEGHIPEEYLFAKNMPTELYEVTDFARKVSGGAVDDAGTEYYMLMTHPSVKGAQYIEWVHPDIGKLADADMAQATAIGVSKETYLEMIEC